MVFFFYGTLMDDELRRALAGPRDARLRIEPGLLLHRDRRRARFGAYPVLVPAPGRRVAGQLVAGVDPHLALWIAHFEGPGYLPTPLAAQNRAGRRVRAITFAPESLDEAGREPWDFRRWQRRDKPGVRRLLQSWLLARADGRPLALDVPWRVRRQLQALSEAENAAGNLAENAAGNAADRMKDARAALVP